MARVVIRAANEFRGKTSRPNELWQTGFTYLEVIGWGWFYLSTITQDSFFEQNERERENASLYFYSGAVSETVEIDFGFGYTLEPVVSAQVESFECRPD